MLFLALAVGCSLAIGVVFKVAARRGLDRMALVTVNYAVAGGAALLAGGAHGVAMLPAGLWGLGVLTGALFIGGFWLLAYATEHAGMSRALGVMRLSVVVPVLASWLVWHERPAPPVLAGLALALAAFALLARQGDGGDAGRGHPFALAALFAAGGAVDVLLKTFDVVFGGHYPIALFLLLVFATAGVLGALRVALRRRAGVEVRWRQVAGWGLALGAANYGSTAFFLEAVARLPGPVVFPLNNVAIVLGGAVLGAVVWREPLGGRARLALAGAAVALALIGTGG